MATGNLKRTVDMLATTYGVDITDVDDLPPLAQTLEENHKFATAKWLMDFMDRLITYRAGEFDLNMNVHSLEGEHLCMTCQP